MDSDEYFASEYGYKRDRDSESTTLSKRRRELEPNNERPSFLDNPLLSAYGSSSPELELTRRPGMRRTAMWVDENDADNFTQDMGSMSRPRTMMSVRPVTAMTDSDYVQMIPDIDDMADEDLRMPAEAPNVLVNKITSLQELEKERVNNLIFNNIDGVSLAPLVARVLPQHEVAEDDKPWTWDNLISDVASQCPDLAGDDVAASTPEMN